MATTQYIGSRYVPLFADPAEWNNTRTYEPLTIVLHEGNSYTSKQYVPVGVDIANGDYWAETGNYNAQVEAYRKEVGNYNSQVELYRQESLINKTSLSLLNSVYTYPEFYGAKGDGVTDDTAALQEAIDTGKPVKLTNTYLITAPLTAKKFDIEGGTLKSTSATIIQSLDSSSRGTFRNVTFDTSANAIEGAFYFTTISMCVFSGCDIAINLLNKNASSTLVNNTITDCNFYNCQTGIFSETGNKLTDKIISKCRFECSDYSLNIGSAAGDCITNNHFYSSGNVTVQNCYNTVFEGNYAESGTSLVFTVQTALTITGNVFKIGDNTLTIQATSIYDSTPVIIANSELSYSFVKVIGTIISFVGCTMDARIGGNNNLYNNKKYIALSSATTLDIPIFGYPSDKYGFVVIPLLVGAIKNYSTNPEVDNVYLICSKNNQSEYNVVTNGNNAQITITVDKVENNICTITLTPATSYYGYVIVG